MKWKTDTVGTLQEPRLINKKSKTIRDSMGKFVHGHNPLSVRDKTTGRFTKVESKSNTGVTFNDKDRHSVVASEVDKLFKHRDKE